MGLALTLNADCNHIGIEFPNAYWAVKELHYDTENVYFSLIAYPTREASKKYLQPIENRLVVGGAIYPSYNPELYKWNEASSLSNIFPSGIPVSSDEQKKAIYQFVKEYTKLPFEDVLES